MDLFAQPLWLVVGRVFTELFSHHGVPLFHFGVCVSLLGDGLAVFFSSPNDLRSRRSPFLGSRWVFLISDSFSNISAMQFV